MTNKIAQTPEHRAALISGLRDHAAKKGATAGWDYVAAMTNEEIDAIIGVRTKSVLGATQMMTQYGGIREMAKAREEAALAEMIGTPAPEGWTEIEAGEEGAPLENANEINDLADTLVEKAARKKKGGKKAKQEEAAA